MNDGQREYWRRFEADSAKTLRDVSTALFIAGKDWVPLPVGTGFVVTTGARFFLVTAKHVLNEATPERPVYCMLAPHRVIPLYGGHAHPTADVICIEVPEHSVPPCTVIHVVAVRPEQLPRANKLYYLSGCPAAGTENQYSTKTTFFRRRRLALMSPDDSVYEPKWNPRHHLLLSFDRKRMVIRPSEQRLVMAPPKGMSGSPVFTYHPSTIESPMWRDWSLAGVLSEWRPRPEQRYMVAEDAGAILECLRLAGVDSAAWEAPLGIFFHIPGFPFMSPPG